MTTNQSPDGYALMHLAGKTGRLTAGDIVALRLEDGHEWQVCIVRWALSENPEHLEIGLQVLATQATAATLALPERDGAAALRRVLVLPKLLPLRPTETMVTPSGVTREGGDKLILVIERHNIELRQIRAAHLDEQTSSVEVVAIEPHELP